MENPVRITRIGPNEAILLVTLNRPEQANAYTVPMLDTIQSHITQAAQDPTIRGAIVTGTGQRSFCAGADLTEIAERRAADGFTLHARTTFQAWADLYVPTIAAINGVACGGGLELALACDMRICTPEARFWLPETGFGLLPAAGGLERLSQAIGTHRAREIILFGRKVDAPTALDWGLVSHITPHPLPAALTQMEAVIQRDPLATAAAKGILNAIEQNAGIDTAIRATQAALYERRHTDSKTEGSDND